MAEVIRSNMDVHLEAGHSHEEIEPDILTTEEARDIARRLVAVADEIDAVRVQCLREGHAEDGFDTSHGGRFVYCTRCDWPGEHRFKEGRRHA